MASPTKRLADKLLTDRTVADSVDQFIADRRSTGKSWRHIALNLRDSTDGQIDVTPETIRGWALATEAERSLATVSHS